MDEKAEPHTAQLADEILKYLWAHPQAADTVEGIVDWWLPRQRHEEAIEKVQQALEELTEHKLVAKRTLVDGTVLYANSERTSAPKH